MTKAVEPFHAAGKPKFRRCFPEKHPENQAISRVTGDRIEHREDYDNPAHSRTDDATI